MQDIILASSSPYRRQLFDRLKLPYKVVAPDIDETPLPGEKPEKLVLRLAIEKGAAVAEKYPRALIISADQVGVINDRIVGKPLTHDAAVKQLSDMSDQTIQFFIGMAVLNSENGQQENTVETFKVKCRRFTPHMIANYLQRESALQCAGSFNIEGLGIVLAEKLIGDDYTALIGLPLIRLTEMLAKFNVHSV